MSRIQPLLDEYGVSHQNCLNKTIHWICVPIIFWSIVALLFSIPNGLLHELIGDTFFSNWAAIVLALVIIYYLRLSPTLAVGMLLFGLLCLWVCHKVDAMTTFPLPYIALIAFVLAWIGQFYGHHVEGKKPSFLKDLQFLLIGPAWLMHFIYNKIGLPY